MTKVLRGNPRLLLQILPVAAAVIILKWLYDVSPLRHLELSPLLTGLIAAEVFIVGFILSGTAADFKEAERLPGELAGSLDSIADECLIMHAELDLPEARHCVSLLADTNASIRRWLLHNDGLDDVLGLLRELNPLFIVFAPKIQAGFTTRLKSEQSTIRKLVLRMDTMRRTSYVSAAYLIAEVTGLMILVLLLITDIGAAGLDSARGRRDHLSVGVRDRDDPRHRQPLRVPQRQARSRRCRSFRPRALRTPAPRARGGHGRRSKRGRAGADYPVPVSSQRVPGGVVHTLPADLRAALIGNSTALAAWKDITPLARNEFICWVTDAKQEKTRERRIRRTQEELEEGMRRPCCWPGCKHRERNGR